MFAIQFVALLGQMNAPIEKSFRSLTLSFSWANLQFGTPDWLLWLLRWVTGDSNIDGKLSYGFGISPGGQELMLLKKGVDAEDFVIGNVYSNVAVMVVVKVSSLPPPRSCSLSGLLFTRACGLAGTAHTSGRYIART